MESRWQRRNERARSLGYRNYYDYRAHRYGAIPAGEPAIRGPELSLLRGHRGLADLEKMIPNTEMMTVVGMGRDRETGQWKQVDVGIIDREGRSHRFRLRGRKASNTILRRLRDRFLDAGISFFGPVSLDVFAEVS